MNKELDKKIQDYLKKILNDRLGDLIAEKKKKGISQRAQANKIGVDVSSLSNYVNGKQIPTVDALYKIARFYNCSTDYLLGINKIKSMDYKDIDISKKLGLSEKAIEKLKKYHEDYFYKDFEYMQLINFLIENLNFDDLKILDRFLFSKCKNFEMWQKNEHLTSKKVSICCNLGKYDVGIEDIEKILLLNIQQIFTRLKAGVTDDIRKRNLFELEMSDLNEQINKIIGESENGEHSSTQE